MDASSQIRELSAKYWKELEVWHRREKIHSPNYGRKLRKPELTSILLAQKGQRLAACVVCVLSGLEMLLSIAQAFLPGLLYL
jgi:hypothetical protein